jgi:hypothetical protein
LLVEAPRYAPIRVVIEEETVGYVTTSAYSDLQGLIASGYSFSGVAWTELGVGQLTVELVRPRDEPDEA